MFPGGLLDSGKLQYRTSPNFLRLYAPKWDCTQKDLDHVKTPNFLRIVAVGHFLLQYAARLSAKGYLYPNRKMKRNFAWAKIFPLFSFFRYQI